MANSTKWYWPDVDNRRNATFAIEEAFWAAIFVSAIMAFRASMVVYVTGSLSSAYGFIDVALFAGIAYGIKRKSRTAAVLALALYVAEFLYTFIVIGPSLPIIQTFFSQAFIQGIRGTVAYHKFPILSADLPTVEQGFAALRANAEQNISNSEIE